MLLENKNAVIYGAGGGIGSAVARAFAREGARLFLAGRTLAPLSAVAEDITKAGGSAEIAQVDALDEQAVEKYLGEVVQMAGGIDITFNAIGIGYEQGAPLVEMTLEEFVPGIADVMKTQFLTTTAAARHMIRKGSGVILAITATPGGRFVPNSGNFGVACAAIESLCRQLAGELGPQGIRVICLRSAGSPDTPVLERILPQLAELSGVSEEAFVAGLAERTFLKRMPRVAEVANAAALMASDYASAMTGAVANVACGDALD
ncbi:MAG TPA: SDR family oxidoreductase [Ktedonobacterales bacterium]|nr:SDR family oxidoreductase [Ktedonobacterales bacterium]